MDLHQTVSGTSTNLWYMHIIDEFTRYSNAQIIHNKTATVRTFMKGWISLFGAPRKIFSDNGGEFIGDDFVDMCETFGIKISTTPSYSPWSNGLCERHNQTLTNILLKIREDTKCDWETALAWAINAKNTLINNNGFSPAQLVYGRNPNLPTILTAQLPALETRPESKTVATHLAALQTARKAFIAVESCEKIKRALRKQTRQSCAFYQIGDAVFYKRDDNQRWKGPAKVLGQDGPVVFLRHGSRYIKAHTCRVQHTKPFIQSDTKETPSAKKDGKISTAKVPKPTNDNDSDSDDETVESQYTPQNETSESQSTPATSNQSTDPTPARSEVLKLKANEDISFQNKDGQHFTAKVLSRAGKATGQYPNWYNIQYKSPESHAGQIDNVDISNIDNLRISNNSTKEQTTQIQNNGINSTIDEVFELQHESFDEAKSIELQSWKSHGVYQEVPHTNQKCISVRWVCTMKTTENGIIPKARLVARGYEEQTDVQKESPTCSKDTLRVMMSIIKQYDWDLKSIDIKTAFLQGEQIDREVFLHPPAEAKCSKGHVWKLIKCVYGLSDASLKWYQRVKSTMLQLGGNVSSIDPALFTWHIDGKLVGMIAAHVDDFLWAGNIAFQSNTIPKLRKIFSVGREEDKSFRYLGLNINQNSQLISVDQRNYIDSLQLITTDHSSDQDRPLSSSERDVLRSKVGQLLWVSNQTCPDVSFDVAQIAINLKNATVKDVIAVNKTIKKLKNDTYDISFQPLKDPVRIIVYTDASFGNHTDGGSQGAYLIFLVDDDNKCNLVSWHPFSTYLQICFFLLLL